MPDTNAVETIVGDGPPGLIIAQPLKAGFNVPHETSPGRDERTVLSSLSGLDFIPPTSQP